MPTTALRQRTGSQPPRRLRKRVGSARLRLEGERKHVTVMFADIKGSLALIAERDAEQAQGLLDSLLETMTEAVHDFDGTVNQVLGDGFVALFGAPIAHEDHAIRAAYAALAIQDAVKSGHPLWRTLHVEPQIRIGLSSGDVVIRAIDNDLNVDYRAVGRTTHLAARMEQTAPPGTTRLSAETMRLVEGFVKARPLGPITIKGLSQPVEAFELLSSVLSPARFRSRTRESLSPFVGRTQELDSLRDALSLCEHKSRVIGVRAEAGMGKSRLAYELLSSPEGKRSVRIDARALSYRCHSPFLVLRLLLRNYLGIEETDSSEQVERRLTASLPEHMQSSRLPLLALLGAADDDKTYKRLDPAERRKRTIDGLKAVVAHRCQRERVLLLIEDLHWADADSLGFVDSFIRDLPARNLLVLLTFRPEFNHQLPEGAVTEMCLPRLSEASSRDMLKELLLPPSVGASAAAELCASLLRRTDGNPFFLEECLRSLVDAGVIERQGDHYQILNAEAEVDLPHTAEAVIAARIDRLPADLKWLLQAISAVGPEVNWALLLRVTERDEALLESGVSALVRAGMLREAGESAVRVLRFVHALIHETVYRTMLQNQRKGLHGKVVDGIEYTCSDTLNDYADVLAEHCEHAERWSQAVRYHGIGSVQAASRFANHEAIRAVDRGLAALTYLPASADRDKADVDLRLSALAALMPLGRKERMVQVLREAEAAAMRLDDPLRKCAVYSQLATALWLVSDHEQALEVGHKALALSDETAHFPLQLAARYNLGMCHNGLGDYPESIRILSEMENMLDGPMQERRFGWATYPAVTCKTFLGLSQTMLGNLDDAHGHLSAGKSMADRLRHPYSQAIVSEELGYCYLVMGRPGEALDVLQDCVELCREHDVHTMLPAAIGRLGLALVMLDEAPAAREMLEEALELELYEAGSNYVRFYLEYALARAHVAEGKFDDALRRAQDICTLTQVKKELGHHVCSTLLLADVYRGAEQWEEAEQNYRRALALAQSLQMKPAEAACLRGMQTLLEQRGDTEKSAQYCDQAMAVYRGLGVQVPECATV